VTGIHFQFLGRQVTLNSMIQQPIIKSGDEEILGFIPQSPLFLQHPVTFAQLVYNLSLVIERSDPFTIQPLLF
jgi:hypothetical protein